MKVREQEIRQEFVVHLDTLFRGNRVQKENEFQNKIIASLDKDTLYSVDYIPSRGKNKEKLTTLYYYNCELLSWLKDTTSLEDNRISKSQKMTTLWKHSEIPKADIANEGGIHFPRSKKPEQLIKRILEMSTDEGDIVLDSFLGSGTTAATAHKMKRKWIGIELGDHAYTHCKPRLDAVIDGKDKLGITKATGWQGGGGYRFYELAPTLILRDAFGEAVISDAYNAEQLAAAVALHEGYIYRPDPEVFWKQAVGTEKSYLFTTTRPITAAFLAAIAAEMQPKEFLKIAATSFPPELSKAHKRITLRLIPEMLLAKCAFGVENYNLPIIDPPTVEDGEEDDSDA